MSDAVSQLKGWAMLVEDKKEHDVTSFPFWKERAFVLERALLGGGDTSRPFPPFSYVVPW